MSRFYSNLRICRFKFIHPTLEVTNSVIDFYMFITITNVKLRIAYTALNEESYTN
jgi:hypothetical protein